MKRNTEGFPVRLARKASGHSAGRRRAAEAEGPAHYQTLARIAPTLANANASGVRPLKRRFRARDTQAGYRGFDPFKSGAEATALQTLARLPYAFEFREAS